MQLSVERKIFSPLSTIGDLLIEGKFFCYTLEPRWTLENVKPRAIPEDTYRLIRRYSPEHKRDVPGLVGVHDFSDVEIHWGNFPKDTLACTLVGKTLGPHPDFIGASKMAFDELWEKLVPVWERGEDIEITYINIASKGLQENLRKLERSEEEAKSGIVEIKEGIYIDHDD